MIRIFEEKDFFEISKLMLEYYYVEDQNLFLETMGQILSEDFDSKRRVCFVAEVDGKIVGKVFLQIIEILPNGTSLSRRFGYVSNLYVKEDYRKKGFGKKLLEKLLEYSKNNNLERLTVWVSDQTFKSFEPFGFSSKGNVLELNLI